MRIGLDSFKSTPRRDERPEVWFQRFDSMLDDANQTAGLSLNITFQSWMLLFLLQLTPRKWSDLLKVIGHRLPNSMAEYVKLQQDMLREKVLENSVFNLRGGGGQRDNPGARRYLVDSEEVGLRPLYVCLGDPGGCEQAVQALAPSTGIGMDLVDVYDGQLLFDEDCVSDSDSDVDSERREHESRHGLISLSEICELQHSTPDQVVVIYWTMREAVRRYKAATGRF